MTITRFQVYGERCSGTNFVIRLLERNLASARFTEEYGFKHWFVDEAMTVPDDVLVLTVSRGWTDWIRSFHAKPWHAHPSLRNLPMAEFLRREWHCVWDDDWYELAKDDPRRGREMRHERDPETGDRFANVLAMRAAKEANWRRLRERTAHADLVRYEAVRADPEAFVRELCERRGISPAKPFDPIETYKGLNGAAFVPKSYPALDPADQALVDSFASPDRAAPPLSTSSSPQGTHAQ